MDNPVAYLFQISRNEASRAAKRKRSIRQALPDDELFAVAGKACGRTDDAEVVAAALGRLDAEARELIELKVFAGFTFREIADLISLPQGTVATRYRRALESLRPWLARQLR